MNKIIVGKYGAGECSTIAEALEKAKQMRGHVDIEIRNGIYDEKIELNRDDVTIIGESAQNTVITYADYANKEKSDKTKMGTFASATFKIVANAVKVKNITIENRSGNGRDFGQAVALYAEGDKLEFYDCRMIGAQDTLYLGPKPECPNNCENELPEIDNIIDARQYYKNCYIQGDIDFIFGGATAFFDECEIFSKYNITEDDVKYSETVKGYIAAPCTWRGNKYGFVFNKCRFTGDCPKNTVYLGRPWRIYAKTVLLECELGEHIKKEGWHDWDKKAAHGATFFAEYKCNYADVAKRADWIKLLDVNEAREYTKENILWEYFCEE